MSKFSSSFSSWEPEAWPPTMPIQATASSSIGQDISPLAHRPPNHILLFTIHNPTHPITTSVLNQVCSGLAYVVRVVILQKRRMDRVQAMVEFLSKEDAQRVKEHLDGAFIYDNCCGMEIEFAFERVFRLKVIRNDDDSWDFSRVLSSNANFSPLKRKAHFGEDPSPSKMSRFHMPPPLPPVFSTQNGRVCMLYDLNMQKMSPKRLFNLFCLYGNVNRVKFLKSKEGSGMIEMSDPAAAERAMYFLSGCTLFGSNITIRFSRQEEIVGGTSIVQLDNGSFAFEDFSADDNNRFRHPMQASKNRIVPPSRVVHFFNLPVDMDSGEQVSTIFTRLHAPEPKQIKIFPKAEIARSLSGLVEFSSVAEAVDAVALCNHVAAKASDAYGKRNVFKLCFSINEKIN